MYIMYLILAIVRWLDFFTSVEAVSFLQVHLVLPFVHQTTIHSTFSPKILLSFAHLFELLKTCGLVTIWLYHIKVTKGVDQEMILVMPSSFSLPHDQLVSVAYIDLKLKGNCLYCLKTWYDVSCFKSTVIYLLIIQKLALVMCTILN